MTKENLMKKKYEDFIGLLILVVFASACSTPAVPAVTSTTLTPQTPTELSATVVNPTQTALATPTESAIKAEMDQDNQETTRTDQMNIQIGDIVMTATLADNSSAAALKEVLSAGPITIDMRDYGSMEKVGSLGMDLPRNDQQTTTEAGDLILYQGNSFVIYYAPNSWSFTRLGKINDVTAEELRGNLGGGNVTVTLSLP
jgi:hypothetical protein